MATTRQTALKKARSLSHDERGLLSGREWQVMRLVAQGFTSTEIGERLSIGKPSGRNLSRAPLQETGFQKSGRSDPLRNGARHRPVAAQAPLTSLARSKGASHQRPGRRQRRAGAPTSNRGQSRISACPSASKRSRDHGRRPLSRRASIPDSKQVRPKPHLRFGRSTFVLTTRWHSSRWIASTAKDGSPTGVHFSQLVGRAHGAGSAQAWERK